MLFVAMGVATARREEGFDSALTTADLPFLAATIACWLVGVILTGRVFDQLAGWAFLGLGTSLAYAGLTEVYAELALSQTPNLPMASLAATLSDTSYVWWFAFLALTLHYTPPSSPTSRWRWLPTDDYCRGRHLPGVCPAFAPRDWIRPTRICRVRCRSLPSTPSSSRWPRSQSLLSGYA